MRFDGETTARGARSADPWTPGRLLPALSLLAVACLALVGLPVAAAAQETPQELRDRAEEMLGRDLSEQEIMEMLRQSGMTPQQIRDRLRQRGLDPSVADPWLQVLEGTASEVPPGTSAAPLVSVLAGTDAGRAAGLQAGRADRVPTDSLRERRREPEYGPPVFGRDIFRRSTSEFQPQTTGPVPPDYRVGPGDQLVLVLTGAVEQAYELRVSREGWVVVPEVGRVMVNGRTMDGLRGVMRERLAQSYASLEGENPATSFDLTLGQLRTNQVYVIGEVDRPSAYTVSSLATALTALYRAGGPTRNGSFREIRVNRGGETVRTIDLYDYLIEGRSEQDVRLQQGDILFVPVAGRQVLVQGPVTRPALYEVDEGEGLRDVLRYAGGVEPQADLARVQIRRILPPGERTPGRNRRVLDVPVGDVVDAPDGETFPLRDGDRLQVFAVPDAAGNEITVSGAVWRPGSYGAAENTRLWDVIEAAGGLLPDAVAARAQIQRLDEETDTRRMIQVPLTRDADGEPEENPRIRGQDQVLVYGWRNLRDRETVTVGGWVRQPGTYAWVEGMTVADLILKSGGVRRGAYTSEADVARPVRSQTRTDTLSRRHTVSLDSTYVFEAGRPAAEELGGEAATFELQPRDAVYVRKAPGHEERQRVVLSGEVRFPGPYTVSTRGERLTDLLERAGGVTDEAYMQGFQLWRADEETEARGDSLVRALQRDTAALVDSIRRERRRRTLTLPGERQDTVVGGEQFSAQDTLERRIAREDSLLLELVDSERRLDSLRRARARDRGETLDEPLATPVDSALQVTRRVRVGIDFDRALENPDSRENVLVEPGDSVHVPQYDPTVTVRGAVGVETRALWREGAGLEHYVDQAGGYLEQADEDRVWIRFASGEVATRAGRFLFFGGGIPDPDPGATVNVPYEPEEERGDGVTFNQLVPIITSVLGTITTIVVATN